MTIRNNIPSVPALAEFLDNAFQQHPASRGDRQATFIFQDLVEEYQEIITYIPFCEIFNAKISTKEMADKIIKWRRRNQGRGQRHRGMAKDWQLFLDAEDILFFPWEIEKKFKISLQRFHLIIYLRKLDEALEHKLAP